MNKKTFKLHIDKLGIIKDLPDHLVGRFLLAVLEYQESGKVLDKEYLGEAVYHLFKGYFVPQFERDDKKYNDMIERNRKNGSKNTKKSITDEPKKSNTEIGSKKASAGKITLKSNFVDLKSKYKH
jgi:hypothetical protein